MQQQTVHVSGSASTTAAVSARVASITVPRSSSGVLTLCVTAQGPSGAFSTVRISGNVLRGAGAPDWNGTVEVDAGPIPLADGPEVIVGDGDAGNPEVLTVDVTGLEGQSVAWKAAGTLHVTSA
jgi:hypothetical protein